MTHEALASLVAQAHQDLATLKAASESPYDLDADQAAAYAREALLASAQAVLTLAARVAELERQLVDAKNRLNRELEVAKRHGM